MIDVNKLLKLFSIITLTFLITTLVSADSANTSRGTATEAVEGTIYSKKKAMAAIERAKPKACKNAFKRYIQNPKALNDSERMIFESIQDQIYNNLNEYMVCTHMVEPLDVTKYLKEEKAEIKLTKKVTVIMRAEIDKVRLLNEINKSSKIFASDTSEKSKLAMIFFSRTVSAQRQFDERVKNVEKTTTGLDINEEETESGISSTTTETNVTETGGSKLKKADVSEYIVDDNDTVKLEAGMKEIFTKARFEPVSGKRQVRKKWRKLKAEIIDSLESGGAIPDEAKWDIEDILMEKNVSYVVFAYFDVGVPGVDEATGNQSVSVALAVAEITRLGDSEPVSLGTISGVQVRGQGATSDMAKNNAINKVSKETAKKLVALINSKGIN